ncbi:Ig-like domain-containing protein [Pseudoflavonifractor intestinihominis]|uniref:Ig-like domain-containing protein n=1 Tax=Pseudoflavonifractor intestinihominis TaxID=3133171 RepID=A0ABV1E8A2_9FIRM|nr:Ig-like domain-containing protein [uncultured Pseudoflavonifractor sp.]
MAAKKPTGARNETVRCENCGEYYAVTYKRCPFCEEQEEYRRAKSREDYDDEEYEDEVYDEDEPRHKGGKRLKTNTRGGGYGGGPTPLQIVGWIISLALIAAAIYIVVTIIGPFIHRGEQAVDPDPNPVTSNTPAPSDSAEPQPSDSAQPQPSGSQSPEGGDEIPQGQTATGFTLSLSEFSLSNKYPDPVTLKVTFSPAGSTGTITWESSDPSIVTVDENGKVSPAGKTGTATITATMAGGYTQTCRVYNSVTSGASSGGSTGSGGSSTTTLSLNRTDFTLDKAGAKWQLKVSGTSSTPTWSIGDSSVATISGDGTVTAVSKGTTTVTATVDGQTLKCIVRCTW